MTTTGYPSFITSAVRCLRCDGPTANGRCINGSCVWRGHQPRPVVSRAKALEVCETAMKHRTRNQEVVERGMAYLNRVITDKRLAELSEAGDVLEFLTGHVEIAEKFPPSFPIATPTEDSAMTNMMDDGTVCPKCACFVADGRCTNVNCWHPKLDINAIWRGGWRDRVAHRARAGVLEVPPRFWQAIGPGTLVPFGEHSLRDATLNLVGYLPLGFLLGAWRRGRSRAARLAWPIGLVFLLSASFETLQFALPERHPSTTDLLLNTLGGALGALLALWWGRGRESAAPRRRDPEADGSRSRA